MKLLFDELKASLPSEYKEEIVLPEARQSKSMVILDDDPTGCQTMHNVPVLFIWDEELIVQLFRKECPLFFIMVNTRSLSREDAVLKIKEVMKVLKAASEVSEREYLVLSRSDSTLRGHYPAEPNAISDFLEKKQMHCLVPAFFQGGRYTVNDIHYVKEGTFLVPASDTPFAKDAYFGFANADMKNYVEEKTGGAVAASDVLSISLVDLREKGPDYVKEKVANSDSGVCIVNAFSQKDLDVFAQAAWHVILDSKPLLFRTAASLINSLAGIQPAEVLDSASLNISAACGGLIVVGSHVPTTNSQLHYLMKNSDIEAIELDVNALLAGKNIIPDMADEINALINCRQDVLLYSSREVVLGADGTKSLDIGKRVSDALVELVQELRQTPSFLISKGGITSHEIAVKGLGLRKTTVIGQALPGVPVVVPDENPGMKYIIFPGNVGGETALYELYMKLTEEKQLTDEEMI